MNEKQSRHSGAGRNPALLFKMLLGFVLAAQAIFYDWIPACAGMTDYRRMFLC
ncbi:MAG: hypothetical protein KJ795_04290 [Gammaproteobacteria bacterium]|nr:hypothetical protein [Gammaproteobacteria bacterium]MBU1777193.1 hypothetical protein [Gammaproteobacteria bacterium]MBU1968943.1 hypothetical protein [Gammaproteobacteria bacterium]